MSALTDDTRAKLATVSTATLTTALFKRGLRNQFMQDVQPLNPAAGPMVGEAYTLRYIPAREDLNPMTVFRDRSHPQRRAVEECPPGCGARHRQPQGRARRVGGVDPRRAADEARRRRRRHRRRVSRLAGNRAARHPRVPSSAGGADEPDRAPGARPQRADRLRRRAGLSRRRRRRRCRRCRRPSGASRRRSLPTRRSR